MTTDIEDVLKDLDSKIAKVYDLELVDEMTDIYNDLSDRINELSAKYWKLVKALARTEKDKDDLLKKLEIEEKISKAKSEECKMVFEIGMDTVQKERKIQDRLDIEKDQAEYDRDYYRDEVYRLRSELAYEKDLNETLTESHIKCIDTIKKLL